MPEFTPRSMRARAHARKPLGALSPNVAAPTGAQKPTGTQKPPRAVHQSVARVVGAAVPAAQALSHTLPPHTQPAPATQPELHQQIAAAAAAAAEYRGEQQPASTVE